MLNCRNTRWYLPSLPSVACVCSHVHVLVSAWAFPVLQQRLPSSYQLLFQYLGCTCSFSPTTSAGQHSKNLILFEMFVNQNENKLETHSEVKISWFPGLFYLNTHSAFTLTQHVSLTLLNYLWTHHSLFVLACWAPAGSTWPQNKLGFRIRHVCSFKETRVQNSNKGTTSFYLL